MRVVGCVPVPNAMPGSRRMTCCACAGTSCQLGTIQKVGVISTGANCACVRRTQSCSGTVCTPTTLEAAKNSGKLGTDGASAGQAGTYKDGTYTGSSQGFGGEIKVKVTVSGKKISAIDIIEASGEDEAYLSMAKDIVKTILDKQTTEVDTISGATYSSTGIKNAVGQALEGADK